MTTPAWIAIIVSVLALVVTTLVNLSISTMQRKQMRQIELHRVDPSIPLIPPPHPATSFLRNNAFFIFGLVWDAGWIVREMSRTTPITRADVFSIAWLTGSAALLISVQITYSVAKAERTANQVTFDKITDVFEKIFKG